MAVDAGTIYSEIRINLDRLRADIKAVDARFDKFATKQTATQAKVKTGWRTAFAGISIAGIAAFAAIGMAVKSAVKIFAGFEQSLANVESVAGATAAEMKELEQAALDAGETTRFTASEAADAMYYLASAGFDAQQSIGALDGVLSLATATQSDLATTSASVAASISQFGFEAEDASSVANIFAAAIANSQATMEKMTGAMRNVGPVAGALDHSLEATTGALQALFDAGFIASQAGVGLRNILASLAAETDPTVQKLALLGVSFDDINTSTHSLAEVIGTLNEANLDAGDILAAFGKKAGPQILTLLKTGEDGINEYTAAVTGTNAAVDAAAIQVDTLQGSFDLLKSVVQSASIQMLQEFAPALRGAVDILRFLVGAFNKLPQPIKVFAAAALVAIPVIGGLTLAITLLKAASGLGLVTILSAAVGAITALTAVVLGARKEQRAYRDMLYDTRDAMKALTREEQEAARTKLIQNRIRAGAELRTSRAVVDGIREEREAALALAEQHQTSGRRLVWLNEQWDVHNGIIDRTTGELGDITTALGVIEDAWITEREAIRSNTEGTDELIDHTEDLAAVLAAEAEALRKVSDLIADYTEKLEEVGATDKELLELERERALASVAGYEATAAASAKAREAINAYFNALVAEMDLEEQHRLAQELAEQVAEKAAKTAEKAAEAAAAAAAAGAEILAETLAARESVLGIETEYAEKLEEVGLTTRELTELERARALVAVHGYGATEKEVDRATAAINAYYDAIIRTAAVDAAAAKAAERNAAMMAEAAASKEEKVAEAIATAGMMAAANAEVLETETDYVQKLEDRAAGEVALIELQRQRAIAELEASGASDEAIDSAIAKLNEYFDALRDDASWQRFQDIAETALDYVSQLISNLGALYKATTDQMIDDLDRQLEAELEAIDARLQAALEAAGVAEETTVERLQRELAVAIEAGDQETAADLQEQLTRAEITAAFAEEEAQLEAQHARDRAQLEYQGALQSWRTQMLMTIAQTAQAALNAYSSASAVPLIGAILGPIAAAAALAFGALQIAKVNKSKPVAPAFRTGGIVIGGGASGTAVTVAEGQSTEALFNSSAEGRPFLRQFAQVIAEELNASGANVLQLQLNLDGRRVAEASAEYYNNGIVRVDL